MFLQELGFVNGIRGGDMAFQRPLTPLAAADVSPFIPLNALDARAGTLA